MDDCLRHYHGDHFYLVIGLFSNHCEVLSIFLHDYTFDDTSLGSCPFPFAFFDARFEFDRGMHLAQLLQFELATVSSDVRRKLTDLVLSGVKHLLLADKVLIIIDGAVLIYSGYVIGLFAILKHTPRVILIRLVSISLSIEIPRICIGMSISSDLCRLLS